MLIRVVNTSGNSILAISGEILPSNAILATSSLPSFRSNSLSDGTLLFNGFAASGGVTSNQEVLTFKIYNPNYLSPHKCLENLQLEGVLSNLEEVDFELVESALGIDYNLKAINLLYPNPTSGSVTISSTEPIVSMKIYTLSGLLVKENSYDGQKLIEMNADDLAGGMYLIVIENVDNIFDTQRLIIVR
jgi:hypothetical protein